MLMILTFRLIKCWSYIAIASNYMRVFMGFHVIMFRLIHPKFYIVSPDATTGHSCFILMMLMFRLIIRKMYPMKSHEHLRMTGAMEPAGTPKNWHRPWSMQVGVPPARGVPGWKPGACGKHTRNHGKTIGKWWFQGVFVWDFKFYGMSVACGVISHMAGWKIP